MKRLLFLLLLWATSYVSASANGQSSSSRRRRLKGRSTSKAGKEQFKQQQLQQQQVSSSQMKNDAKNSNDGGYVYHDFLHQNDDDDEVQATTAEMEQDIYKCNMTLSQYKSALQQLLLTITPQEVLLNTPHSPQSKALEWLIYNDTLTPPLCPPENNNESTSTTSQELLQRYIMTAFYYATNGDNWTECSSLQLQSSNTTSYTDNCSRTITAQSTQVVESILEQAFSNSNNNTPSRIIGTNSWLTPTPTCTWGGLACTHTNSHHSTIDHIELEDNNLSGTLLSELSSLSQLKFLILEKGQLSGTIPPSFGSLSNLRVLDMDYNVLSGTIPSELYNLVELRELDLNDNRLTGVLDGRRIGGWRNLVYLQLDGNEFVGSLPGEIGGLKDLAWAVFHGNNFSGEIPMSICENSDRSNPDGKLTLLTADCSDVGPVVCSCCDYCG